MNPDWQEIFYILSSLAALLNIVLVIAILIGGWAMYRQLQTKITLLESTIKHKFNFANLSLQTARASIPFLAAKVITNVMNKLLSRR